MVSRVKFWSKVQFGEGCWEWTGVVNGGGGGGYGILVWYGQNYRAHRLAWELTYGPLPPWRRENPDSICVLHRCDNPLCCNPDHLFLGTHADNMADMYAKGRGKPWPRASGFKGPLPYASQPRGERAGGSRLTETKVRAIRESSSTQRALAKEYGVSQVAICKIRAHKTWAHVV